MFKFSLLVSAILFTSIAMAKERIISTDAFVTDLVVALGAAEELVGIDVTSKLPEGSKTIANIGYHRTLSAEGILSLAPSLVIGSEHIGPPPVISSLKSANVKLVQLKSASNLQELKTNIANVAFALSRTDKGNGISNDLNAKAKQLENNALRTETVAFLLSMDPSKLRLAGKHTSGDALIKLLGANNVADFINYQSISAESLLAMDPSIILVAGRDQQTAVEELIKTYPVLKHSQAALAKKVLTIDGASLVAGLSIAAVDEALRIANTLQQRVAIK